MIDEKENREDLEETTSPQSVDITSGGPEYIDTVVEDKKPEKKKKSKVRSTIEWIFTILFAILFVAFGAGQIDGMIHKNQHYGQMVRFGTSAFSVETDSMAPLYPVKTAIINYLDSEEAIVNRYNASKSDLYMLDDAKPYFNGTTWEEYTDTVTPSEGNKFIYYNNSISGWNNPHLVSYSNTDSTIWPGLAMEKIKENIYRLEIKSGFDRVIFTSGDYIDISFFHNEYYASKVLVGGNKLLNPVFKREIDLTGEVMTHRLNEVKNVNGVNYFIFAGINPDSAKFGGKDQYQICTYEKIIGVVKVNSPFIGGVFKVISSAWGLLIFLLIPALYLAVTSVIDILKTLKENENSEEEQTSSTKVESLKELSKEDRERLKKEMLEEMLNSRKDDKK